MMKVLNDVLFALDKAPLIPVFYHEDLDTARTVLDAAYESGIRVFEFTNRGEKAPEVFAGLKKHVAQYSGMSLGIGTILNADQARQYIDLGADLIVSPILRKEVADVAIAASIPWVPGCATLTEIVQGWDWGASLVKIFPGSVLGPGFVKAVKPVIPHIRLMPTGGVEPTAESLKAWFDAGVFCVGMGSQLIPKDALQRKDLEQLIKAMHIPIEIINVIRK